MSGEWSSIEWGSVAEWATGGVGAGALMLTGWALRSEVRSRAESDERQRRLDEERRREHARLLTVSRRLGTQGPPDAEGRARSAQQYTIENTSGEPFYDIMVSARWDDDTAAAEVVRVIQPGGTAHLDEINDASWRRGDWDRAAVAISFADYLGSRWRRDPDGRLSRGPATSAS